jgi:dihydroxyacetone kinase-like protein
MGVGYPECLSFVQGFAKAVAANREFLTQLDAEIGDADHGINMDRGMRAVIPKVEALTDEDISGLFRTVAMALISTVGGASGPLYGTVFLQLSSSLKGKSEIELSDWAEAVLAAVTAVRARGKAEPGDKTMVDALLPAAEALRAAADEGMTLAEGLARATAAAHQGMEATIPLLARRGRASYLGERSQGHQDPGATSSWLLMQTAEAAFAKGN